MRPRDFLVDAFRSFVAILGVVQIFAVSDTGRHHHHSYFRGKVPDSLSYNEIWRERGGTPFDPDFFELPVPPLRRKLDEIASKKRSMYRKRYEMLDDVESKLRGVVSRKEEHVAE
jgi:uncharacterized protein